MLLHESAGSIGVGGVEARSGMTIRRVDMGNNNNNSNNTVPMSDGQLKELQAVINERDKEILQQSDETFRRISWEQAKDIVSRHGLDELSRKPTDLRKYTIWKKNTVEKYGSIHNYLVNKRLGWGNDYNKPYNNEIFKDKRDLIILKNDFPYGFDDSILHIVVWTRTPIPLIKDLSIASIEANGGDMPSSSIEKINEYIDKVFIKKGKVPKDEIIWFKNWFSLQSVPEIVHFHVLIHNPPFGCLDGIIGTSGLD